MIEVRSLADHDSDWKSESLRRAWGSTAVARLGALVDVLPLPGFVALLDDHRVGLLTYDHRDGEIEVVTLHTEREGLGVGRALMDAARSRAIELEASRLWLCTTNTNYRAFRFYQRCGMDLESVVRNGVALSRAAKPSIPAVASDGVPIRHELRFELLLP